MIWQNAVCITVDEVVYHFSVAAGRYADEWIFKVDEIAGAATNKKLLPRTIYLRFDSNKEYSSCLPAKIVPQAVSENIAAEIKKYEDSWIKAIRL